MLTSYFFHTDKVTVCCILKDKLPNSHRFFRFKWTAFSTCSDDEDNGAAVFLFLNHHHSLPPASMAMAKQCNSGGFNTMMNGIQYIAICVSKLYSSSHCFLVMVIVLHQVKYFINQSFDVLEKMKAQ
jgi:hypothetical protein